MGGEHRGASLSVGLQFQCYIPCLIPAGSARGYIKVKPQLRCYCPWERRRFRQSVICSWLWLCLKSSLRKDLRREELLKKDGRGRAKNWDPEFSHVPPQFFLSPTSSPFLTIFIWSSTGLQTEPLAGNFPVVSIPISRKFAKHTHQRVWRECSLGISNSDVPDVSTFCLPSLLVTQKCEQFDFQGLLWSTEVQYFYCE